jgi:hypothetical protein
MSDWVVLLPMAEFAYNNSRTTATAHLPFYANYGHHPNSGTSQPRTDTLPVSSKACGHWMMDIYDDCQRTLEQSRETTKMYADRDRTEAPKYSKGDLVMLSGKNIRNRCPCKKLDHKLHGPFEITEIISVTAVRLNPEHMENSQSFPRLPVRTFCPGKPRGSFRKSLRSR